MDVVITKCPRCGKDVMTYWMSDNTGCISSKDYVLVADWAFHAECYDAMCDMLEEEVMPRSLTQLPGKPEPLPQALRFEIMHCPSCPNAHIILFDEADHPFAQMVIGPANLQRVIVDANAIYDMKAAELEANNVTQLRHPKP